jgi:septum site-determining protein MinC
MALSSLPFPNEPPPAFELKGRMMTLSVLRVLSCDLDALREQIDEKIAAAPELFQNFPVLLDFEEIPAEAQISFDIARFDAMLRERSFAPVGIRGAGEVLKGIAAGVGLGVVTGGLRPEPPRRRSAKESSTTAETANLLVRQPVRSGQQVYAKGGDLIVMSTVSPGAEILADGNIHIYGALRGRALAGVRGNLDARIFCRTLDAELISIAGHYRVSEQIPESDRTHPVQIFLERDQLIVESL